MTLPANGSAYTAIVRGVNRGVGIGLVEVYDLNRTVDSKLGNVSTRGLVRTGDNVLIGGFIVVGTGTQRVVVRAVGPSLPFSLGRAGSSDARIILTVMESPSPQTTTGVVIRKPESTASGLAPQDEAGVSHRGVDAAPPPENTAIIVRGKNETTGVALVEVYALD